jgi:hypothetical protein
MATTVDKVCLLDPKLCEEKVLTILQIKDIEAEVSPEHDLHGG